MDSSSLTLIFQNFRPAGSDGIGTGMRRLPRLHWAVPSASLDEWAGLA